MCLAVYISTDRKIKTSEFVENETYFYIEEETINNDKLQDKFKYNNIYYCGSYTCCSCGFNFDFYDEDDDEDRNENMWGKKSLDEMFTFFRNEIDKLKEIEMFVCWEGDEECEPKTKKTIELSKFEFNKEFHFDELEYIQIIN